MVKRRLIAARELDRVANQVCELRALGVRVHCRDYLGTKRHTHDRRPDQVQLQRARFPANGRVPRLLRRLQDRVGEGIDRALAEYQPVIGFKLLGQPEAFTPSSGETGEPLVFDFIAAKALSIEVRKYCVAVR